MRLHIQQHNTAAAAALLLLTLLCSSLCTTTLAQSTTGDIAVDSNSPPSTSQAAAAATASSTSGLNPELAAPIGAPSLGAVVPEAPSPPAAAPSLTSSSPSSPPNNSSSSSSSPSPSPSPAAVEESPNRSPSPSPSPADDSVLPAPVAPEQDQAATRSNASPASPAAATEATAAPSSPAQSGSQPTAATQTERTQGDNGAVAGTTNSTTAAQRSPAPPPPPQAEAPATEAGTQPNQAQVEPAPTKSNRTTGTTIQPTPPATNRTTSTAAAAPNTTTPAAAAAEPRTSSRPFVPFLPGSNSRFATNYPLPDLPGTIRGGPGCNRVITPNPPVEGDFTDDLNSTVSANPKRPNPDVPLGDWIPGRATFYGADERLDASRVACGEPPGQFGVIEQGACGYTNSDNTLPFPREMYAAAADANADFPGSCGRCYQVRCKTGAFENNGRQMRSSDLPFNRGVYLQDDNVGRPWPGSPWVNRDITWTQCWDEQQVITVRVADACPCQYSIAETGEVRHQPWCCGGANHFDLSFWAFEQLAHPSYGVINMEYRPVDCETNAPLKSIPGFVNQTIFGDTIEPGWSWRPYSVKNSELLARGQGVGGSVATCASLSQKGAFVFACRECNKPGYQPFAKAKTLQFDIRSNTRSDDPFASSTPPGRLPPLKLFMMNDEGKTYCGAEVVLGNATTNSTQYATRAEGDWYTVQIPLSSWQCDKGSVGGLTNVDRVDFQNVNERDADVCLDNIALV